MYSICTVYTCLKNFCLKIFLLFSNFFATAIPYICVHNTHHTRNEQHDGERDVEIFAGEIISRISWHSHHPRRCFMRISVRRRASTLRSLLFKGTNFCVFCDLEKFAKFKDRKIYAACASGAALYSMRTLRAR